MDMNKGAWTAQEDNILIVYVETHGEGKWSIVSKKTGLRRCGKSCRVQWLNYLRPNIKRGNISPDEEDLIRRLHKLLGNRSPRQQVDQYFYLNSNFSYRWSLISGRLPGRTESEIKNHWNTVIRRKIINNKKCKSKENKQNRPSNGSYHLLQTDPDKEVHMDSARRIKICNAALQQSQKAKKFGTDFEAEPSQDGKSGNGNNVAVEPIPSSDVSISSTEGKSLDYKNGFLLRAAIEVRYSNFRVLEIMQLC